MGVMTGKPRQADAATSCHRPLHACDALRATLLHIPATLPKGPTTQAFLLPVVFQTKLRLDEIDQMGSQDARNRRSEFSPSIEQFPDLERIYNTIPIGLAFLTPDCRYARINPRMTEICGIPVADHLGRSVRETLPRLALQVETIVHSVVTTGEPITGIEVSGERPDESGAKRYWTTSWQPMRDDDGTIIGVNVAAEETTQRKRAEAALEFAKVSRHTAMSAMTASIAHEITQPLAAIATNARAGLRWLAKPTADLEEARAALERIAKNGQRASDIIASIRGLFGNKSQQPPSQLDVNAAISEVLALVHGEIVSHHVIVQTDLSEGLPEVEADRIQLQQVLINLITNAIEAMSAVADHERMLLIRSERPKADSVLVTVQDSGTGIDPKNVDRIFDPFFTTKSTGMGLGLSICRSITRAHGGDLWALPDASRGAVFHLALPVREAPTDSRAPL